MIVKKPIGSVKIGNTISRLTVGKPVPQNVLDYWKETEQIDALMKSGAISESDSKSEEKEEKKKSGKEKKKGHNMFLSEGPEDQEESQ